VPNRAAKTAGRARATTGYLRRDSDPHGFQFWLAKLNQFNGDFIQASIEWAFGYSPASCGYSQTLSGLSH